MLSGFAMTVYGVFKYLLSRRNVRGWEGQETKRLIMHFCWSMMKNYLDEQKKETGRSQVEIANVKGLVMMDSLEEQKKAGSV